MPRTHLAPPGDVPSASARVSPPLAWGSSSSLDRRLGAVALRADASSSGHRFTAARGKRGGNAGGREAGDTRRPGPPVVPQVISAPARTHVDKSSSPVRARGAPSQPAGRSVPAASIPLRRPRLGLPSVWRPPRCGSGGGGGGARAGERASECVCRGSGERAAGKEEARAARMPPLSPSGQLAPRSRGSFQNPKAITKCSPDALAVCTLSLKCPLPGLFHRPLSEIWWNGVPRGNKEILS